MKKHIFLCNLAKKSLALALSVFLCMSLFFSYAFAASSVLLVDDLGDSKIRVTIRFGQTEGDEISGKIRYDKENMVPVDHENTGEISFLSQKPKETIDFYITGNEKIYLRTSGLKNNSQGTQIEDAGATVDLSKYYVEGSSIKDPASAAVPSVQESKSSESEHTVPESPVQQAPVHSNKEKKSEKESDNTGLFYKNGTLHEEKNHRAIKIISLIILLVFGVFIIFSICCCIEGVVCRKKDKEYIEMFNRRVKHQQKKEKDAPTVSVDRTNRKDRW